MSGPDVALAVSVFLACAVEAVESLTIVLAVGVTRGWRSALLGVGTATVVLAAVVAALGPALTAVPINALRVVVGGLLLIFGLQWLRKAVLRAAGLKALHDEEKAFAAETEAARSAARTGTEFDGYAFTIAFKGVLLEGIEVILIVTALGARPGGLAPALIGAFAALFVVAGIGVLLHQPLARLPETHLKYMVGIVLSTFGVFFASEGLGVHWPLGDAALLYIAAAFLVISQLQIRLLGRERELAPA